MHAGAACRFSPSPPPPCPVFCNVFGGGWFFSCFFLARECREKRNSARCTWWLSSVLGKDWDVGWQGRARSPPPYIAILPPGSHWQWCNPSWSSPSWSWPTQVEGHHGQGEAVLVFRYFGGSLSGLLRAPPTVPPHESVEDLEAPRDRRNFYGDPDRAAPPAGAGPGRCQSRLGASSLSPLVLHVPLCSASRASPPSLPNVLSPCLLSY